MTETGYQMLEVLSFCHRGTAQPPRKKNNSANFSGGKKYNEAFWRVYFLRIHEKIPVKSRARILRSLFSTLCHVCMLSVDKILRALNSTFQLGLQQTSLSVSH